MSINASDDGNPETESDRQPSARYIPPVRVWIIIALSLVVIAGVKLTGTRDPGITNVITFVMALVAAMTAMTWFTLSSGHRRMVRMAPITLVLIGLVAAIISLKVSGFSGALIPTFRWRFSADPDEMLDQPVASPVGTGVDLLSTTSDDFPRFLGRGSRATVDHVRLASDWTSSPPRRIWRQPIGAGWSALAAVNGYAVTMEQRGPTELVTCYDVKSGAVQWSHGITARHETKLGGIGPRSTPTINEGRVYALGATGVLRCLDGATGRDLWVHDLLAMYGFTADEDLINVAWGRAASPLIVDQLVVVPVGGPRNGRKVSLAAFDKVTGSAVWESGHEQVGYASPTVATILDVRQILIVNESSVSAHAVNDGHVLWEYPFPGQSNAAANNSQAVPVGGDRIFVSKGYGVGAELFQVSIDDSGSWQTQRLWKKVVLKTKFTNAVVYQDHVYGLDDGILSCVELASGRRVWKRGRYGHGQVLLVGDKLLVQTESGEVLMLEASATGHQVLGRFQAIEGKSWNNLCLYGPYLLVRNADEAACYELPLVTNNSSPSTSAD